jgi:transposase-like protein
VLAVLLESSAPLESGGEEARGRERALSSGNVIATAKRHGIQAQQIYRWRERLY